ncbi:MAG: GNAT family N-acetyltransferase [Myxococcales bacterium]|nr:GNAT family N-acetyltransferase [Myxococcales bacterium]
MAKSKVWVEPSNTQEQKDICFAIRQEVFVEGQNVPPHEEWDDLDQNDAICPHFIAWTQDESGNNIPIGTARLWLHTPESSKAQRVAVLDLWRGHGVGRALMDALEEFTWKTGRTTVVLGAQTQAIPFYQKLGYQVYGPEYLDAGIPHRDMKKER